MKIFYKAFLVLIFFSGSFVYAQPGKTPGTNSDNGWKTYQGANFTIKYPPTWELKQNLQSGVSFILFSPLENAGDKFRENINLVTQDLAGQKMTLEKFTEVSKEQIKDYLKNAEVIESKTITTSGKQLHKIIYKGESSGFELEFEQYYFIIKEKAYVLTLTSEQTKFASVQSTAEKILNSFIVK